MMLIPDLWTTVKSCLCTPSDQFSPPTVPPVAHSLRGATVSRQYRCVRPLMQAVKGVQTEESLSAANDL